MSISIEEATKDLEYTRNDIRVLNTIISNLSDFIYNSGGEDRSSLKIDLYKYQSLLNQAKIIELRIQEYINKL
jgi:hypothetical protein